MRHGALPEDRKENAEDMRRHGQDPNQKSAAQKQQVSDTHVKQNKDTDDQGFFNTWSKIRHHLREPIAEWLGVSIGVESIMYPSSRVMMLTISTDNSSNDNRPLRNPLQLHLKRPRRLLPSPKRSLGVRLHGRHLHNRWYIWWPHESRNFNLVVSF